MFHELKVLELASVLAGPALANFSPSWVPTVIKVENPKTSW